jgi:hypothetical protein
MGPGFRRGREEKIREEAGGGGGIAVKRTEKGPGPFHIPDPSVAIVFSLPDS